MTNADLILDEQYFSYFNMTLKERDFYLNLLNNCKDICDTDQIVNGSNKCEIVQMSLKKEKGFVYARGSAILNKEVRYINADIFEEDGKIFVDMFVERLNNFSNKRQYRILDVFKINNGKLQRVSEYNYDMQLSLSVIDNEEIKEKLR